MDDEMGIFSILATPLGYLMKWIYMVLQNYGWTIIAFTFLIRIAMFPLSLKQQKSTARMAAYQPLIQEIQKKWATDKNRQNQEVQKFYTDNDIKMSAGCAPMLVNMLVLFGMIAVIQAPLTYILQTPPEQISNGIYIVEHFRPEQKITENAYTQQSILIGQIKEDPQLFIDGIELTDDEGLVSHASIEPVEIEKINDFRFRFMGLDLAQAPSLSNWVTLIMPILSLVTMLGSQLLTMFTSAQQQSKMQMWIMTIAFGVMFGFFAFRVPSGFSLYYTTSNIVMALQQLILRKIYDPNKIKEEVLRELEER
ncbi:MAG: YidC/Oxa1 family membrane protein insertase, partial [Oscillospiraceae bacterium]